MRHPVNSTKATPISLQCSHHHITDLGQTYTHTYINIYIYIYRYICNVCKHQFGWEYLWCSTMFLQASHYSDTTLALWRLKSTAWTFDCLFNNKTSVMLVSGFSAQRSSDAERISMTQQCRLQRVNFIGVHNQDQRIRCNNLIKTYFEAGTKWPPFHKDIFKYIILNESFRILNKI